MHIINWIILAKAVIYTIALWGYGYWRLKRPGRSIVIPAVLGGFTRAIIGAALGIWLVGLAWEMMKTNQYWIAHILVLLPLRLLLWWGTAEAVFLIPKKRPFMFAGCMTFLNFLLDLPAILIWGQGMSTFP